MVSKVWTALARRFFVPANINQKFTPNQIIEIFGGFSANLPQCKHLRFIDG
jgi:hypothetical protein